LRAPDVYANGSLFASGHQLYGDGDGWFRTASSFRAQNFHALDGINVNGSLSVGGNVTANYVQSASDAYFPGTISGGHLSIGGNINVGGNVIANYFESNQGYVTGMFSAGALTVQGGATISGETLVNGHLRTHHVSPLSNNEWWCGLDNSYYAFSGYEFINRSDPAEKRDIQLIEAGVTDLIASLNPRQFRWRAGPDTENLHWGFLAPEVKDVMGADFGGYVRTEAGVEGICSHELVAVLWRGVQDIITRLAKLEARP
jgi:hypothetical protein